MRDNFQARHIEGRPSGIRPPEGRVVSPEATSQSHSSINVTPHDKRGADDNQIGFKLHRAMENYDKIVQQSLEIVLW